MDGEIVPLAASHREVMSYGRGGAGRGFGRTGGRWRGRAPGAGCTVCAAPAGVRSPGRRGDRCSAGGAGGSGSGSSGAADGGSDAGSRPNGRASTADSAPVVVRSAAGAGRAGCGGPPGRTDTHPAVSASEARIRGRGTATRRNCIHPPCRTRADGTYAPSRERVTGERCGGYTARRPCATSRSRCSSGPRRSGPCAQNGCQVQAATSVTPGEAGRCTPGRGPRAPSGQHQRTQDVRAERRRAERSRRPQQPSTPLTRTASPWARFGFF